MNDFATLFIAFAAGLNIWAYMTWHSPINLGVAVMTAIVAMAGRHS